MFNAPIRKDDLMKWITEKTDVASILEIETVLTSLISEELIIEKNGLLAVWGKEEIIDRQEAKSKLTQELIRKGSSILNMLGKLPFIRFIGISGSVAAENPTRGKHNHVDLDIFIITSKNVLWITFLFERILTSMIRLAKKDHFYCFNYVTEENFLEINNKNFYTASELVNLIPVIDKGIFNTFIMANQWFKHYYSSQSIVATTSKSIPLHVNFNVLKPLNYVFFCLYNTLKAIRKFNPSYAFRYGSTFDPTQRGNLKRISPPNGGYQEKIKLKFIDQLSLNFPLCLRPGTIDKLFPMEASFVFSELDNADNLEVHQQFIKYA